MVTVLSAIFGILFISVFGFVLLGRNPVYEEIKKESEDKLKK